MSIGHGSSSGVANSSIAFINLSKPNAKPVETTSSPPKILIKL